MLSYQDNLENSQDSASGVSQLDINIQAEVDHWQKLIFSFDMDERHSTNDIQNSQDDNTSNERGSRSRSHSIQQQQQTPAPTPTSFQDAVLLAQFAAAAGLPQTQPAIHDPSYAALLALLNAQRSQPSSSAMQLGLPPELAHLYDAHDAQGHLQPTLGNMNWPQPFNTQQLNQIFGSPMSPLHYPQSPVSPSNPHASPSTTPSSSFAPQNTSASSSTSPTTTDANETAIVEDKRQRNTAASARFRIKKKQRNLNLERTVSDLTGRADELEREAADLRRENGWLKEIVMLKGSRLAGLDVSPHTLSKLTEGNSNTLLIPSGTTSSSSQPRQGSDPEESASSDDGEYTEGPKASTKGKGKGKKK